MNLFDELVNEALKNQPSLTSLRNVVEKELLHHDILRILSHSHLLTDLTFIGGTCLRTCYGGIRLSEDLDFTGGKDFTRDSLSTMAEVLQSTLKEKYGLEIKIDEPVKDNSNVDTWKIKIETKPQQRHFPAQRINIDICAVHSYEKKPMLLLNPYGVEMGTTGLVIQAQSREEIYADKLLAFALRPNRLKHRDLWDMVWLHQQGLKPRLELIPQKLNDRSLTAKHFLDLFAARKNLLKSDAALKTEFKQEMQRFLPVERLKNIADQGALWNFTADLIADLTQQVFKIFPNTQTN